MEQEKIGKLIKDLRKKHNLTQKDLADKLGVTYQAVSKWENGLNMPDTALIKKISDDFGISLNEMLEGNYQQKKRNKKIIVLALVVFVITVFIAVVIAFKKDDFDSKILSSNNSDFNVSGIISYSDNKSAIYINNIKYQGNDKLEEYKKIECSLYETSDNFDKKIDSKIYEDKNTTKLEEFLESVTLTAPSYEKICKEYSDDTLYLTILATNKDDKTTSYKIPLKMTSNANSTKC